MKNKKKKSIPLFSVVVLLIVFLFILSTTGISENCKITIPEGTSTTQIAKILKENKVIKSEYLFLADVTLTNNRGKLKYGTFDFSPNDNIFSIINKLVENGEKKKSVSVTIPEGYSNKKIIEKLVSSGLSSKKELEKALNDSYNYDFLNGIDYPDGVYYKLEGFLFPSTYDFYTDLSAHEIIDTMLKEFQKEYLTVCNNYNDIYKIITLASLVEREAKLDSERPIIAGVLNNRLKQNMRLQIDASVIYAITKGDYDKDKTTYKDLKFDSKYNTYRYNGLPLGPIANPGIKSIKAVLDPDNNEYLYYRTNTNTNDGSHIFTKTFEEHKTAND